MDIECQPFSAYYAFVWGVHNQKHVLIYSYMFNMFLKLHAAWRYPVCTIEKYILDMRSIPSL